MLYAPASLVVHFNAADCHGYTKPEFHIHKQTEFDQLFPAGVASSHPAELSDQVPRIVPARLGTLAGKRANERRREKSEGNATAVRNGRRQEDKAISSADIKQGTTAEYKNKTLHRGECPCYDQ